MKTFSFGTSPCGAGNEPTVGWDPSLRLVRVETGFFPKALDAAFGIGGHTLQRRGDKKFESVGFFFFFCFDPSFVSAEMGVDYLINLPKIKTPWLRGVFLYIFM